MQRMMFFLVLSLLWFASTAWAYSGGTGEPNNPYQIATAEDLIALGNEPNDYNDCFILTADIDLSGYVFNQAVIAPDDDAFFNGSFNGQGYTIRHLSIQGRGGLGLFGRCLYAAVVSNLRLEAVDVNGTGGDIGGLVGWNHGILTSCYCSGTISGNSCVSGLSGWNSGIITSSYSTGTVNGKTQSGGLVGWNMGGIISCYSSSSINGANNDIGGLVGINWGTITSSCSTGCVSGNTYVGGLVGNHCEGMINSSYSIGLVSGNKKTGGLVGSRSKWYAGTASSFWNVETSGQTESDGGLGLTTAEMQDISTFQNAGWDFVNETKHGTCNYWIEREDDYPCLAVFSVSLPAKPLGIGTVDDPFMITDFNELGTVWSHPGACYRLDSDIDLTGINWNSSVIPVFSGQFDGNGHLIRNLKIEGGGCLGLFGGCKPKGRISHLRLETVDVNSTGVMVGGLVGWHCGEIVSCHSSGSVTGDWYVGGLVGYNSFNSGIITASYSQGNISGNLGVGGLVGYSLGPVTSCYSTGSVDGYSSVGGLVGWNGGDGIIVSSYSTGSVCGTGFHIGGLVGGDFMSNGEVLASFWDTETSKQVESYGGTGLPTSEMQDINTYLGVGWDFVDETANGTDDIWTMPDANYPRLTWEFEE